MFNGIVLWEALMIGKFVSCWLWLMK